MWGPGKGYIAIIEKFHLADSKGLKLVMPSTASVDDLLKRIAHVTGTMTNKDVLAINLSPLPRYQVSCCVATSHGLQGYENPRTLNTLLRDIGVYMGRSGPLHLPGHADIVVSPVDCVGPTAFNRLLARTTFIPMGSSWWLSPWHHLEHPKVAPMRQFAWC